MLAWAAGCFDSTNPWDCLLDVRVVMRAAIALPLALARGTARRLDHVAPADAGADALIHTPAAPRLAGSGRVGFNDGVTRMLAPPPC